jgi:hypothetical protein
MTYTKEWLVGTLQRLGYVDAAEEALRELPEEFDLQQLEEFGDRHGLSRGDLVDRMGGSP